MSRRPQNPSISTNIPRDNVNSGCVPTHSPHARTPFSHSPALSDSMTLRAGKRPLESQSYGETPPDKRSRPPDSRSTLQDRYAISTGSRIPSPPPSGKSSFAGLSNVPIGPRLASDQHRLEGTQYQRRQDVCVLSPSSIGSGASTPAHSAPPAPSMLPATDLNTLRRPADATSPATDNIPITMQSLRRLKERKRAIAHQMTTTLSKTIDLKLTTQAMDIAYLKKERDQINKAREEERTQIMRRLDGLEAISTRYDSLMDRSETLKLVHAAAKPLAERLEILEQSTASRLGLQKGLQDLATVPNRLAVLETRQTNIPPKPEPNRLNALESSELKYITDRLSGLEAANGALAKIPKLENDITALKNAKELHKIDIDTLKAWKDGQPETVSEETTKDLIAIEVEAKASVFSKTLREKAEEANGKHAERITKNEISNRDFQTQLASFQSFREKVEKQRLADQLSALYEKVRAVEGNDAITYAKAEKLQKRLKELENQVSSNEVNKMHDRTDKLEDTLNNKVERSARDLDRLSTRVDELEKAHKGPSYTRVGTHVLPSPVPNTSVMGNLDEQVGSHDKSLQQLHKIVVGKNGLSCRVDAQEGRIDSIEANSTSARPLDTVEQTVETTGGKTLDKTVETTAEKAAERRVEALVSSERKAAERNLGELETRLMEEIQASRNRTHGSGLSSAEVIAHINDIQRDLDTLFEKVETQDITISSLSEHVPNLFNEHFDPLKTNVAEQLCTISNTLEKYGHDLSNLMQQVSHQPAQQNSFGQQQQAQLDAMVAEAATLKSDFAALKLSLSTKADAERMGQQLEGITFALNNLQSRYDNISTDDLYKRLVVWFTQMYPSFTQILENINQLKAVKVWVDRHARVIDGLSQDADHLRGLVGIAAQLHDLAKVTPHVQSLVSRAPQLQTLVNSAPALDQLIANAPQLQSLVGSHDTSQQTLAKIEQACSDAKMATTKAGQANSYASSAIMKVERASSDIMTANAKAEQALSEVRIANIKNADIEQRLIEEINTLENVRRSVTGIQKSLHDLNPDKSPFAKPDVPSAAQPTTRSLQNQIN